MREWCRTKQTYEIVSGQHSYEEFLTGKPETYEHSPEKQNSHLMRALEMPVRKLDQWSFMEQSEEQLSIVVLKSLLPCNLMLITSYFFNKLIAITEEIEKLKYTYHLGSYSQEYNTVKSVPMRFLTWEIISFL